MTTHEKIVQDHHVEPGSDRSFGLIVGSVLILIGCYQWLIDLAMFPWFLSGGLLLTALGLMVPRWLHPANVAWTHLGLLLGRIVTPVVMLIVYVVSIIPTGLLLRAAGKDPLKLKRRPEETTYWIARQPPGPQPESLENQF